MYALFCGANKEHGIDMDMFKQLFKGMLCDDEIVTGKTERSHHTVLNYKYIGNIRARHAEYCVTSIRLDTKTQ